MSETKIKVPDGMLTAAKKIAGKINNYSETTTVAIIEAALLWQRVNAPVPTPKVVRELIAPSFGIPANDINANMTVAGEVAAREWSRRMYDVPEPEFEQKEVFFNKPGDYYVHVPANGGAPEVGPIKAYRRGQQDRK